MASKRTLQTRLQFLQEKGKKDTGFVFTQIEVFHDAERDILTQETETTRTIQLRTARKRNLKLHEIDNMVPLETKRVGREDEVARTLWRRKSLYTALCP